MAGEGGGDGVGEAGDLVKDRAVEPVAIAFVPRQATPWALRKAEGRGVRRNS
jgi:hypothetical protein